MFNNKVHSLLVNSLLVNSLLVNRLLVKAVFPALIASLLSSCSIFETSDNAMEPTPLEDITEIAKLKVKWSSHHGVGADGALVKLSPVIIEDKIVVIDREGQITAIERDSGRQLWQKSYETKVSSGLSQVDGFLFFSDDLGFLYAVSAINGDLKWKQKLTSLSLSLATGKEGMVVSRTIDGNVIGLDIETGEERWLANHSVPVLTYRGNSSPILHQNKLLIALDNAQVLALNFKNGQTIWTASVAYASGRSDIERMVDIDGEPIIVGEQLFAVSLNGNVAAIDMNSGKVNWSRKLSSFTGIAHDDSNLYITDENSQIWALKQDNGAILWQQDKLLYRHATVPGVLERYIFVADFDGVIHVMSKQTGAIIGRDTIDSSGYLIAPIILDKDIYWYGASGQIDRFNIL